MSEYYYFTLNFTLRRDTPVALLNALTALSQGRQPDAADVTVLPRLVQQYVMAGDWNDSPDHTAPTTRLSPYRMAYRQETPADAAWRLHYERVFHDDEFWNGGMYLIYWLFQFAAKQGHLAIMQLEFDAPPEIYTKVGNDIVVTRLSYNPETHQALDFRDTPLDPETPIAIAKTTRQDLTEMLGHIAFMADGLE